MQLSMFDQGRVSWPEVFPGYVCNGAGFSPDRRYRYWLSRKLDGAPGLLRPVLWIMLNPSIADETQLDPTLRRCRDFSARLGGNLMLIGNLYALVSTDPKEIGRARDPVGELNDLNLTEMIRWADKVIVGWGAHPMAAARARWLRQKFPLTKLYCLGANADGSPKHPLYLKGDSGLATWTGKVTGPSAKSEEP